MSVKKTRYYSLKGINTIWIIPELKIIKSVPKIGSDVVRPSQLQIFLIFLILANYISGVE